MQQPLDVISLLVVSLDVGIGLANSAFVKLLEVATLLLLELHDAFFGSLGCLDLSPVHLFEVVGILAGRPVLVVDAVGALGATCVVLELDGFLAEALHAELVLVFDGVEGLAGHAIVHVLEEVLAFCIRLEATNLDALVPGELVRDINILYVEATLVRIHLPELLYDVPVPLLQIEFHKFLGAVYGLTVKVLVVRLSYYELMRVLLHQVIGRVGYLLILEPKHLRAWVLRVHVREVLLDLRNRHFHLLSLGLHLGILDVVGQLGLAGTHRILLTV